MAAFPLFLRAFEESVTISKNTAKLARLATVSCELKNNNYLDIFKTK